jgi:hypothetical protein
VVSRVKKDGDLIERARAVAGIISPDNRVDRVIEEVAFDREAELGKNIVAGFEIVTDSWVENGFAVDGLIAKTGAPGLEKVHTDGGAKDRALVRSEKILKRARGVLGGIEWDGFRGGDSWCWGIGSNRDDADILWSQRGGIGGKGRK